MEFLYDSLFYFLLAINFISGIILLPYPINMFLLSISSSKWKDPVINDYYSESELPLVTIQLPVYNETNVIKTTLSRIAKIVYPQEKIHIQILDDSTDHTSQIIDFEVALLVKQGFNVNIIRRNNRTGYKAGALARGLDHTGSDFVAIFDADFRVDPFFLEKTIHFFKNNEKLGAINTRWEHSNQNFSFFTQSMSIGIDQHFLVEKPGRKLRNAFMNFNGTGGIWRVETIKKSGGWSSVTLAEDLDLAYRAQSKDYEIIYLRDATNAQEIPPTIRCWIIQQSRWSKGFSQNLRKNYIDFLKNSNNKSRIQGTLHLTQYFVPLMILINTTSGSILLYFPQFDGNAFFIFGILFIVVTIFGIITYMVTVVRAGRSIAHFLFIPFFLFWGAGLIVRMGIGTISGLFRKGGEFVKTPKFNLSNSKKEKNVSIREKIPLDKIFIAEIAYMIVLLFGLIKGVELGISYLSQVLYYAFLLFSMINLILSELLHAFFS
ncbi:MAG: glycosyltransferase [Candidatus Hodarchaeales archaeon]|jgi:cellulose synthase/poly-beta-1,6-N-acetylglucosamine synthase-like glycosyltransferase